VNPTAKSLILDLLSTLRRGTMPVSALVETGALFGIAGNSVRVAITRLLAGGQVERDARGRYRLGAAAQPVGRRATAWRKIDTRQRRWDSGWIGVLERRPGVGNSRRRRDRALRLLGFRALAPALCVRPDNLRGGIDALRAELGALGLPPGDLVFELRKLDPLTLARARALWDTDELRAAHRELREELVDATRDFDALPVDRAMVASFLLGGRAIRQLTLDPLLPDAIAPGDERRQLLEAMLDYDRLGRTAWAGLLARFDVPHLGAPANTQMGAGADRLAR
jgi:phenylacetic acid degradation operon negative regulatory protein